MLEITIIIGFLAIGISTIRFDKDVAEIDEQYRQELQQVLGV